MEIYSLRNLSFSYPGSLKPTIEEISFNISEGEWVTVCGLSGSGKSTLLRQLKPVLRPHGDRSGIIEYFGKDINKTDEKTLACEIGFVLQSPDFQTVTDNVRQELAFGLENIGLSNDVIRRRVAEASAFFGLDHILNKRLCDLSGGQRQIVNLAAVMIMQPRVVILDEPTSQLDPSSAEKLIQLLVSVNRDLGTTVIICEHDLERTFSVSSRILIMSAGKLISDESPYETAHFINNSCPELLGALPVSARVYSRTNGEPEKTPLNIADGRKWLSAIADHKKSIERCTDDTVNKDRNNSAFELKNIYYRYDKMEPDIISGLSLTAYKGEIVSLLGENGSGKTTLLNIITGHSKPYSGKYKSDNGKRIALLPQDPRTLFVCDNVKSELLEMLPDNKKGNSVLKNIISLCGLGNVLSQHPYDLSGGEQQKLALAKLILYKPDILLLDEPVKGVDCKAKDEIASIIKFLAGTGICVIIVSHDMDFCAEISDRCAMLHDGILIGCSDPRDFFCKNAFYTTAARRMSYGIIQNAITYKDILDYLGINNQDKENIDKDKLKRIFETNNSDCEEELKENKEQNKKIVISRISRGGKSVLISFLSVFAFVPVTIFLGTHFFDDGKYLFISLVIMLECMVPFFALFENKHIRTREFVLISVMCAMCIASRAVFFGLPQFKPVTAMIIITGAVLGAQSGFLAGAVTMLLSNMLFGQGPWTPWQMFAMGIIGFLSGFLFERNILPLNRCCISVYGFFAALLIYGGIMDPAAMIMSNIEPTWENIRIFYLTGLPLDLIHAASTAVFLIIASKPIIRKVERVKHKYGLIE